MVMKPGREEEGGKKKGKGKKKNGLLREERRGDEKKKKTQAIQKAEAELSERSRGMTGHHIPG